MDLPLLLPLAALIFLAGYNAGRWFSVKPEPPEPEGWIIVHVADGERITSRCPHPPAGCEWLEDWRPIGHTMPVTIAVGLSVDDIKATCVSTTHYARPYARKETP